MEYCSLIRMLWKMPRNHLLMLTLMLTSTSTDDHQEFCHNDRFTAQCSSNEIILMTLAQYGRMALGRCVKKDYGYIGCGTDVIDIAHAYCSGRRTCEIPVPNSILDSLEQPCPEDFKSYLKAAYSCQRVLNVQPEICSSTSVEITAPSGLIPSILSQEKPCGTYKAPWLIKAPPGQTIQITLIDYSVVPLDHTVQPSSAAVCVAYASIREKGIRAPFTLCGGKEMGQEGYMSESNAVEIIVQGTQKKYQRYFVLQYSFHGCHNLPPPVYGWVKRSGDITEVGCDQSEITWSLSCKNGAWVGENSNCTAGVGDGHGQGFSMSTSLSIALVILIALCISVCILLAGLVYLQSRRRRNGNHGTDLPPPEHGQIVANEENYRKAFYEGFPPKPDNPHVARPLGPNGENIYASIQDYSQTSGNDDLPRSARRNSLFSYYEPTQSMSQPQFGTSSARKCSGTINVLSDPNGELREYFVLDQKAQKSAQFT